jgi:hypothetical protein
MDTVAMAARPGVVLPASRLEPLVCARCGAPQPIGDADTVRCARCGTVAALPPPYRTLRDANRVSASDASQLDALAADISRPPSTLQRVAIVVGYGVGILTLVVFAIGAAFGAVLGVAGAAKAEVDGKGALVIIALGALVFGLMSVPFVGEWLVAFATFGTTDQALAFAAGGEVQWPIDAGVAGILYFLSVVPIAIAWRTSENVSAVKALQAKLAAQPPVTPGGACGCRNCGAALDVRPGALAARCLYCGTESLVAVPLAVAQRKKNDAAEITEGVRAEAEKHERNRRSDRVMMWTMVALGPLLVPLLCGAGWLLHALFR